MVVDSAPPDGWGISTALWEQTSSEMQTIVLAMAQRVSTLEARIVEMESKVTPNSTNSSRPPSSDPPNVVRPKKKRRSKRKRGGQPGHPGAHRPLHENPDVVLDYEPEKCESCSAGLKDTACDANPVRLQEVEIPEPRPIVTERRLHRKHCPSCGHQTTATLPTDVAKTAFGPRLETTVAMLAGRYRLSHREIKHHLGMHWNVEVGLGSIPAMLRRVSAALEAPTAEAWDEVRAAPVRYVDETGWREEGGRKAWLWVADTDRATAFRVAATRGGVVLNECFGEALKSGVFVSDRCRSYRIINIKHRGICHAHVKRDFVKMTEMTPRQAKKIGTEALTIQKRVFKLRDRCQDGDITREQMLTRLVRHQRELRKVLEAGTRVKCAKEGPQTVQGMCRDLMAHWDALWTFATTPGVEATNNRAERAVRKAVLWRKGSFGTQSDAGSRFVERILTVTQTCVKQGLNAARYVESAVRAFRQKLSCPQLIKPVTEVQGG
jgi:transposase